MKKTGWILLLTGMLYGCSGGLFRPENNADYVDPFIGTSRFGNTFPGAAVPFGFIQLSPDTPHGSFGGYAWEDHVITGFSHTHMTGGGAGDCKDILVMPGTDHIWLSPGQTGAADGYASTFEKSSEKAVPGYYRVVLDKGPVEAELTTTTHVGIHRYTFPESGESNILIDLNHGAKTATENGWSLLTLRWKALNIPRELLITGCLSRRIPGD
ncbi:MAG: hypothetical protein J7K46_09780 [Bacteroidales bacterium]|nr:hypothetical protein [Bacteroidales bacterium]